MPSSSWEGGSTRAWRRVRAEVLKRDGYRCQLKLEGCKGRADQVHHIHGKAITGDNPDYLAACCGSCNQQVGEPTRHDPAPKAATRW